MNELQLLKRSSEDLKWFISNIDSIKEDYENQIVAINNKKIVSDAKNIPELFSKLKKLKAKKEEILIKQVPSKKEIVIFRL